MRQNQYSASTPSKGFTDIEHARQWAADFVRWYNTEHHHSGIRYVTQADRHGGRDCGILAARHEVNTAARERHPSRWSRGTRNWAPIGAVTLNPEREAVVAAHSAVPDKQPLAA